MKISECKGKIKVGDLVIISFAGHEQSGRTGKVSCVGYFGFMVKNECENNLNYFPWESTYYEIEILNTNHKFMDTLEKFKKLFQNPRPVYQTREISR